MCWRKTRSVIETGTCTMSGVVNKFHHINLLSCPINQISRRKVNTGRHFRRDKFPLAADDLISLNHELFMDILMQNAAVIWLKTSFLPSWMQRRWWRAVVYCLPAKVIKNKMHNVHATPYNSSCTKSALSTFYGRKLRRIVIILTQALVSLVFYVHVHPPPFVFVLMASKVCHNMQLCWNLVNWYHLLTHTYTLLWVTARGNSFIELEKKIWDIFNYILWLNFCSS